MSITTPIIGQAYVIANQTTQLTNSTPSGVWTSSNTSFATIDSATGLVTGVASGLVVITYTVGADIATFSLNVEPSNITNGLNLQLILSIARNRIKWESQGSSDSGRYYQDFHALCDEGIIRNLAPQINPTTDQYAAFLSSLSRCVILDALNSVFNSTQIIDEAKLIFNRYGYDRLFLQSVQNQSQFVGISWNIAEGDFAIQFKKLILFFNANATFDMYLYNDMVDLPVKTFSVTVSANTQKVITTTGLMGLDELNYITSQGDYVGGRWYLGYYQDDIQAQNCQALFFNIQYQRFKVINPLAFSAPVINDINTPSIRNFNRVNVGANNLMYGMNAEVCSYQDPTNKIIQSIGLMDNLFGLLMAKRIIEMIIFSYRNNKIQVNIMGNDMLDKLYLELNAKESTNPEELNFSNGLRKQISDAKRVVKQGFNTRNSLIAGCG